ncbi:Calmodulin-dependent protein kinase cmk2 [Kickxella alabastrina]|uniref:Calmodulin-dependent protein kinase cmk2 n=1 Tax=Kickxella alabastrina TaxID=61397 RepID=A0ACC1IP42_9FUNG|nr:Calmodulin-dependent protein kinase cmk2 [Kickxella alabastrina]
MSSTIRGIWHQIAQQPQSYERKQYYTFGKVLGAGTFGEVREATFNPDGRQVAIKVIKKAAMTTDEQMVLKEIDIVRHLNHPNIVKLLDWFESKDKYYLVFQLCTGGELFEKLSDYGHFTEDDARKLIRCAIESIAYLHKHNIVHRDIKPENLIFLDKSENAPLMLADFGIARIMRSNDEILNTMCGSFGYAAPEILLRHGHGKAVDMWSMGVVAFSVLCGYSPFWKFEEPRALLTAMQSDNVEFLERFWWGISEHAKDFICQCLRANPQSRMIAEQALNHPWLTGSDVSTRNLLPDVLENFNAKATLRRAVVKLRAINRMKRLSMGSASKQSGSQSSSENEAGEGQMDVDTKKPAAAAASAAPAVAISSAPAAAVKPEVPEQTIPGAWTA